MEYSFHLSSADLDPQLSSMLAQLIIWLPAMWLVVKIVLRKYRLQREKALLSKRTQVAQYTPLAGFSVWEIGLAYSHGNFDGGIVGGTLIDLANRGIIKLTPQYNQMGKVQDYQLELINAEHAMSDSFEKALIDLLFVHKKTVSLTNLAFLFTPESWEGLVRTAYLQLQQKEIFTSSSIKPLLKINMRRSAMMIVAFGPLFFLALLFSFTFPAIPITVLLLAYNHLQSYKNKLVYTNNGLDVTWYARGLYAYLHQAERYRHRFFEQENINDSLLPYSVALGITPIWDQRFDRLIGAGFSASLAGKFPPKQSQSA